MHNKFLFVALLSGFASVNAAAPAPVVAPAPQTPPRVVRTLADVERKAESTATTYKLVAAAPVPAAALAISLDAFYVNANAAAGQACRAPLRRPARLQQ